MDISISVIDLFFSLYYCDRFSFSSFYGFGFHSFNLSAIAEVLAGLYGIQFPVEVQMLLNCRKAANKLLYMLPSFYFQVHLLKTNRFQLREKELFFCEGYH